MERSRPAPCGSSFARTALGGWEAKAPGLGDEAQPQLPGGVGNVGACGQQTAPHSLSKAASVSGKCHSPACFPAGRSVSSHPLPSPHSPRCLPAPWRDGARQDGAWWDTLTSGWPGAWGGVGKAGTSIGNTPWWGPHPAPPPAWAPLLTRQLAAWPH